MIASADRRMDALRAHVGPPLYKFASNISVYGGRVCAKYLYHRHIGGFSGSAVTSLLSPSLLRIPKPSAQLMCKWDYVFMFFAGLCVSHVCCSLNDARVVSIYEDACRSDMLML